MTDSEDPTTESGAAERLGIEFVSMSEKPVNPFAPSQLDATVDRPTTSTRTYEFKSAAILLRAITILMACCILLMVLFAVLQFAGNFVSPQFLDPNTTSESAVQLRLFGMAMVLSGINVPVILAIAFVVCWFMYRTNGNCRALGATDMKFTPGWCCGYWFIPLFNLFRPYQAMKEIYKASVSPSGNSWQSVERLSILPLWWTGWLLGDILENAAELTTDSNLRLAILIISAGLKIIAGLALIRVVRAIVREQQKHVPTNGVAPKP